MTTNYPTTLDDNTSLIQVTDGVSALDDSHHNNLKDAVFAMQAKLGIYNTSAPTSLDYRLGHPTLGHSHNGASGQGPNITRLNMPVVIQKTGSMIATSNFFPPVILPRTLILDSIQSSIRRGPSGASTVFDVNFGPTSVYQASQGFRPGFAAGATAYRGSATPNYLTYPSGAIITVDVDAVGSSEPGQDASITLWFRDA